MIHYRYKGFHEYAKSKGVNLGSPVGLDVLVDGIVPTGKVSNKCIMILTEQKNLSFHFGSLTGVPCLLGSGLSSSAAFVCSATIAIMAVFGHNFDKVLLSNRAL